MENNKNNKRKKRIIVTTTVLGLSLASVLSIKEKIEKRYQAEMLDNSQVIMRFVEDGDFREPEEKSTPYESDEKDVKAKEPTYEVCPTIPDYIEDEETKPHTIEDSEWQRSNNPEKEYKKDKIEEPEWTDYDDPYYYREENPKIDGLDFDDYYENDKLDRENIKKKVYKNRIK